MEMETESETRKEMVEMSLKKGSRNKRGKRYGTALDAVSITRFTTSAAALPK